MSICGLYQCSQQFVLFGCCCPPQPSKLLQDRKRLLGLRLQRRPGKSQLALKHDSLFKFVPKAAASASPSSSPAEFSEQLLGGSKPNQKRQRIAGIDQDELQDPTLLADPDSCFCEFKGVQIHHKICDAESLAPNLSEKITVSQVSNNTKGIGFPMILSTQSGWYCWFLNISSLSLTDARHSAGSLVAVDTYFEAPERVAAMVLVAPAILAPLMKQNLPKDNERGRSNQKQEEHSDSEDYRNPIVMIFRMLTKLTKYIAQAILHMLKGMRDMISSLYKKPLSALLRSAIGVMLVRMVINKFGIPAVRNSWYDSNEVTDHVLQGYTKPLKVKGWDRALVEYTVAMLTDSSSESKPPLAKRLNEISCPVLIVTGDSDRLVPPWNSERLSKVIPGSCLEVIKNCGHLPHEEKAEQFVSVVEKFLRRNFGASEELALQAVT